ncbi:MAG TPA: hypothetical protein V6C95_23455 [Coleofasciculaceae cyanobacterium]
MIGKKYLSAKTNFKRASRYAHIALADFQAWLRVEYGLEEVEAVWVSHQLMNSLPENLPANVVKDSIKKIRAAKILPEAKSKQHQ